MLNKKILVTGSDGLVGTHLKKILKNAIYVSKKDYDLTDFNQIEKMFIKIKPTHIIHLAAKVGGIIDNINNPINYFDDNILMNTLMIKYSYKYNVNNFIGILSSCVYPNIINNYPLKEEDMHFGPPIKDTFCYGISKRILATQIDFYNYQYGTKYNYVIPCNIYGNNKKDDENKSHFVTALIKKIYKANFYNEKEIILYGDGTPLRQFIHADDIANILKTMIEEEIFYSFNVATNENLSIDEISKIALKVTNSNHLKIIYDNSKPNGQLRKDLDVTKFLNIFKNYKFISLEDGLKDFYEKYTKNNL